MVEPQSRDKLQKKILKDIRRRYIFAVGLIGSFAILTFAVNQTLNRKMNEDFKTINLSGRQRMLSQRIALLSFRNDDAARAEAAQMFQEGLEFLLQTRFVHPEYKEVYGIYKGKDGLEEQSRELIARAQRPLTSLREKEELYLLSQKVLNKYEIVTNQKQHISESEFRRHLFLEILLLLVNLAILAFEVMFIFRPMVGRVQNSFDELRRIEEQSFLASRLALIGEIASSIGHEIKNPLFVIQHYVKKLASSTSDEEKKVIKEHLDKDIERISRIIKALSTQSREASHDAMDPTPLGTIIDEALEMFAPRMKYQNIQLIKKLKFDGAVRCRHAAISQVIANLVANAIDALAEAAPANKEIQIESGQDTEGIFVRIMDSGPGVPPELTEKIFESFITTKDQGKGTGLGLPISKKIMQEHNGSLSLNTLVSRSCFELRFPAA